MESTQRATSRRFPTFEPERACGSSIGKLPNVKGARSRAMLGLGEPYRDVPFFWSAHYDVTLNYVGHASIWDRIIERGSLADRKYVAAFEHWGTILAVVTLG